jgi:hypothetical protein
MFRFGKLRQFEWLVKIMIFAKKYSWVQDCAASVAIASDNILKYLNPLKNLLGKLFFTFHI